jgi:hypothetical protein
MPAGFLFQLQCETRRARAFPAPWIAWTITMITMTAAINTSV